MNKIFKICIAVIVASLFGLRFSYANSYKPTLYITSPNKQVLVDNRTSVELFINTLGTSVEKVDVVMIVKGAIRAEGLTYNMHPRHHNQHHRTSGLELIDRQVQVLGPQKAQVKLSFSSVDDTGFNEGSGAIPLFEIGLVAQNGIQIKSYIEALRVVQIDGEIEHDNYNPESKPYVIQVIGATTTPYPTPIGTPVMTALPTPTMTPIPVEIIYPVERDYDAEFDALNQDIEELRRRQDKQEEEIGVLRQMVNRILQFFRNIF